MTVSGPLPQGRGAQYFREQSASVLWDTDTRDVRGPYYTGAS